MYNSNTGDVQCSGMLNAYFELIMTKMIDGCKLGIKINVKLIQTIIFADDQAILEEAGQSIQKLLNRINKTAKIYKEINVQKIEAKAIA